MILEPPKLKSLTVSIVSPSICHEVMGKKCHDLHFLNVEFNQMFHSPLSLSPRGSLVSLHVLPHVFCISEVIDISPGNLDSSLCFFQSSVSHDVLCIEVK